MTLIKRLPFTIALVLTLVIVAIATGALTGPTSAVRSVVGLDLEAISRREWWSLLTTDFFTENLGQLITVVIAAALCVGAAEWLMGTWRTCLAFVVSGVIASALGLGIEFLGVLAGEYWAGAVSGLVTVDPLSPILGTLAAASAFASVLWRRRIRFVVVAAVVVFLLYSGLPSDFYRVLAVAVGLAMGALLTRQRIRLERWTSSHHEARVLLAAMAAIFALGPIITLLAHGRFGLLSALGNFVTAGLSRSHGSTACTVLGTAVSCNDLLAGHAGRGFSAVVLALVPLAIMFVGAWGLLMGRRAAVYLVAIVSATNGLLAAFYFGVIPIIGTPSHVITAAGRSSEFAVWLVADAILPIAFAIVVLSQWRHFPIKTAAGARRRFVTTVSLATVAVVVIYVGVGTALGSQFRPAVDFLTLLEDLPERFIPVSFLDAEVRDYLPATLATRLLYHGVGPVLWLVILVALVLLLRRRASAAVDPKGLARFRELARISTGSMSFPGTWPGNSHWFDAEGRMGIAYRIANGCAVTTSEPVGNPVDRRDSLAQFIRFCDVNAWTPVFYGIHEDWAAVLIEAGWSSTVIAEETVIDPEVWTTSGKKLQDVRSSVNRATREGVTVTWGSWRQLTPRVTNQIAEISELWVVEKKLPELGFTLGGMDELRDPDVLIGVAIDASGLVQAVTSWLPTWNNGELIGLTLDFMRRRADGMNGAMEFLIAEAAARAQADGLDFLSLSGAPLAVTSTDVEPSPLDRVLAMVGRSLEPVYGFRSLLNFKQKFQPRMVPLYVAYPDALSLPAIAIALSRCYLPELSWKESAALVRSLR